MTDSGNEPVEVPAWAAREALHELGRAIERTGGDAAGIGDANTPLAEVRDRVDTHDGLDHRTLGAVQAIIDDVADERGVDQSGADPLIDRTFRARNEFKQALDTAGGKTVATTFAPRYADPILAGEKTKTVRLDFASVAAGDTLVMADAETRAVFARATVAMVVSLPARDLVASGLLDDGHRSYADVDELAAHLHEFYPGAEIGAGTQLTVLGWTGVQEVAMAGDASRGAEQPQCTECGDGLGPRDASYAYEHRITCHDCYGELRGFHSADTEPGQEVADGE